MTPSHSWALLVLVLAFAATAGWVLWALGRPAPAQLDTWTEEELERRLRQRRAERAQANGVDPARRRRILQLLGADYENER